MTQPAFPPNVVQQRPRVALSCFTIMLGDIMRNMRVERAPRTVASPRPPQHPALQNSSAAAALGSATSSKAAAGAGAGAAASSVLSVPSHSLLPESTESVVRSMGVDVGARSVGHISDIAILPGVGGGGGGASAPGSSGDRMRPATFVDAAKFIANHCWQYWFDHAPYQQFQHLEAFYIDEYEGLSIMPFAGTTTVNGCQASTFVCGIIEGGMRAMGFHVVVNFSAADENGLQQFQILPLKLQG